MQPRKNQHTIIVSCNTTGHRYKISVAMIEEIIASEKRKYGNYTSFSWYINQLMDKLLAGKSDSLESLIDSYQRDREYYGNWYLQGGGHNDTPDQIDLMAHGLCISILQQIISLLVKSDIEAKKSKLNDPIDDYHHTELHIAALSGKTAIADALIEAKANVNTTNFRGETPLMSAAYENHNEIMALLIKAKSDIDVKDNNGKTALIWATIAGHLSAAKILIEAKAELKASDKNEMSALDYAVKNADDNLIPHLIYPGVSLDKALKIANDLPNPTNKYIIGSLWRQKNFAELNSLTDTQMHMPFPRKRE